MTTWLLPVLTAILGALGAGIATRHKMRLDAAKERSDRDSARAREMRDALKEKRRAILDDESANIYVMLEPIEDEGAFLHNAELRARLKCNCERTAQWSVIHGYASRREVVETYLGDAIADLEAAVRGDGLPAQSHRAAWLDMIYEKEIPQPRHYAEVAAAMMAEGIDPDFEELQYEAFCEERERRQRSRRWIFSRMSSPRG
ncbi:hypothetical protein [Streptomyces sp. NPDC059371]|uniref:hypothetical protein n=1 Tax=Streptomyces sp. NPDC059371 TaxID=3346812 RepID=UPI0036CFC09A